MQSKRAELEGALSGRMGPHQQFLLQEQLVLVNSLDASIQRVNEEIARRLQPHAELMKRLDAIPGLGQRVIQIILAEIGPALSLFPSAAHLASWAGLCPGNHESAGRQRTGRTRKGTPWLRTALVEAAEAAARVKHSYLGALFRRLAARRGVKRALARTLAVPDMTTTVLTLTLTGLAADSMLPGTIRSSASRRLLAVASMVTGAFVGAALLMHLAVIWPLVLALIILVLVALSARALGSSDPAWVYPKQ